MNQIVDILMQQHNGLNTTENCNKMKKCHFKLNSILTPKVDKLLGNDLAEAQCCQKHYLVRARKQRQDNASE